MRKLLVLITIVAMMLAFSFGFALRMHFEVKEAQVGGNPEQYRNYNVVEAASFIIAPECNIRSGHSVTAYSISDDRRYTWSIQVEKYYSVVEYDSSTWWGVLASDVNPEDAPESLAKWCEKHPSEIFWFCEKGGAERRPI